MTMTTNARLQLRPHVPTEPASHPVEVFQNNTLRPVLKLQHDLLLQLFMHFAAKRKFFPAQTAKDQRYAKVKELIARDNRLRGLLFGLIIGQFTSEELTYYCANEAEMNRRLTTLITQRLLSSL
ncbi:MAG: hypothetical protein AAF828_12785 [Bacteroidota bacterium]